MHVNLNLIFDKRMQPNELFITFTVHLCHVLDPLPDGEISDLSKLKAFADDKIDRGQ